MQTAQKLYETSGVYGTEEKYGAASDRFRAMLKIIDTLPKPMRILDVGCGTGYFSSILKAKYPDSAIHGFDVSTNAIDKGKRLYPDVILQVADAEKAFPYFDNNFDLVISGEHVAHLKEADTYVSEIYRILKPSGHLLITTPNLSSWLNRMLMTLGMTPYFMEPSFTKTMASLKLFGKTFPDPSMPPSGHLRLYSVNMLNFLLSMYGFKTVNTYGISSLTHKSIKSIDRLFKRYPKLASGFMILAQKPYENKT